MTAPAYHNEKVHIFDDSPMDKYKENSILTSSPKEYTLSDPVSVVQPLDAENMLWSMVGDDLPLLLSTDGATLYCRIASCTVLM